MPEKERPVNDLTQFNFHGCRVRTVADEHGNPWFIATDVARILGYAAAKDMTRSLDDDEKGGRLVPTPGGTQELAVITEPGLYQAIAQRQVGRMADTRQRDAVRAFQRWVTHEVLPEVRRTGQYGVVSHITKSDLARMVLDSEAAREAAEQRVAELEPPARAWEALADSTGDYSMRDAAQILARDPGIDIGQNRLAKYLREIGWVDARGIPYQAHVDLGRITAKPQTRVSARTGERVVCDPQTRITLKGLGDLHRRLNGTAPLDTTARHLAAVPA